MELPESRALRLSESVPDVGDPTRALKYPADVSVLTVCSSSYKIQVFTVHVFSKFGAPLGDCDGQKNIDKNG